MLKDIFIKWNFIFVMRIYQYDITCNLKKSLRSPIKTLMCREAAEMKRNEASPIIFRQASITISYFQWKLVIYLESTHSSLINVTVRDIQMFLS